jgi:hypothetical protein
MKTEKESITLFDNEDLNNLKLSGWCGSYDEMSGVVEWFKDRYTSDELRVHATPNWSNNNVIPFQISNDIGDILFIFELYSDGSNVIVDLLKGLKICELWINAN